MSQQHTPTALPHVRVRWPSGHATYVPVWVPAKHARYGARQARSYTVPTLGARIVRSGA